MRKRAAQRRREVRRTRSALPAGAGRRGRQVTVSSRLALEYPTGRAVRNGGALDPGSGEIGGAGPGSGPQGNPSGR